MFYPVFGDVNCDISDDELMLAFRIEVLAMSVLIDRRSAAVAAQEARIVAFLLKEIDEITYRSINLSSSLPGPSLRRCQVRDYLNKNSGILYESLCEWENRDLNDFLLDPNSPFRLSSDYLEKCFAVSPKFRSYFDKQD